MSGLDQKIRKKLKDAFDICHGMSSKPLEAALKSTAAKLKHHLSEHDKNLLLSGEAPGWWTEPVLSFFGHSSLRILGRVPPEAAEPCMPDIVPELVAQGQRSISAKAFDYFQWVDSERIEAHAKRMLTMAKHKKRYNSVAQIKKQLQVNYGQIFRKRTRRSM